MKKSEIETELADLKAQFEQRVVDRVQLILQARMVAPGATFHAGASDEDIRRRAIASVVGDAAIADKSAVYIEARFDHLAEQKPLDPVSHALAYRASARHH